MGDGGDEYPQQPLPQHSDAIEALVELLIGAVPVRTVAAIADQLEEIGIRPMHSIGPIADLLVELVARDAAQAVPGTLAATADQRLRHLIGQRYAAAVERAAALRRGADPLDDPETRFQKFVAEVER